MASLPPPDLSPWIDDLRRRHLASLTHREVVRGLRAVSSSYVERRATALPGGRVLDGAGKRAAFALYYGPLHLLATWHILQSIDAPTSGPALPVMDVGCGTGAVGAAAALATGATDVHGLDVHPWALAEARHTYQALGLQGTVTRASAGRLRRPARPSLIVCGYVANELSEDDRARLGEMLSESVRHGSRVLVIEPLARAAAPWWTDWTARLPGAQLDEWKLRVAPPEVTRALGESAGLTPTQVNVRTAWCGGM